jgi:hypothetical protein
MLDSPVPENGDGAAPTGQGITPCAISEFNLFEYYLRAAIAEVGRLNYWDLLKILILKIVLQFRWRVCFSLI